MEFKTALVGALKVCGKHASDPILLYSALCDKIGNDYLLKPEIEVFHLFNKEFDLVKTMSESPEVSNMGVLLDRCKKYPDAPVRLCLRWIHTLFEYYYRKKKGKGEETERFLSSVEIEIFGSEAVKKPEPKKEKKEGTKEKKPKPKPKPKAKSLSLAPQPPAPIIPDKAYVYVGENSPDIHVSADCPRIRPALGLTVYRATYERARYKDFVRVNGIKTHHWYNFDISKNHTPPICPICGSFTPVLSHRNPKRVYKQL